MSGAAPRFLSAGDGGLVAEFGDEIDAAVNHRVVALDEALSALHLDGVKETVPTYRSLLVLFDPVALPRARLIEAICGLVTAPGAGTRTRSRWRVPVHYGGACGMDLDHVAALHGLSPEDVVALHSGVDYQVYMIGFAPGFAYLGGVSERLHTSRRTDPRPKTPPRSISIGGKQTAVSPPLEIPSGWHLLGQTPVRSYDPLREDRPFLFEAGDVIRFEPVDFGAYSAMLLASEAGEIVAVREDAIG